MEKTQQLDHTILALGEATGHAHRVIGEHVTLYETTDPDVLLLEVGEDATVIHEEHRAQSLAPGSYTRHIVREYDHFAEESKMVQD